jgi:hypothetical protein
MAIYSRVLLFLDGKSEPNSEEVRSRVTTYECCAYGVPQ